MPLYEYRCQNCGDKTETPQAYFSTPLTFCKVCKTEGLERLLSLGTIAVKQEPKTLGHQAYRNTETMSTWELESRVKADEDLRTAPELDGHKAKRKKANPVKDKRKKKLASATPQQIQKYVERGELP